MPQASATAGLAACEQAAQSPPRSESTAVAALGLPGPVMQKVGSKLLKGCALQITAVHPQRPLLVQRSAHSYMSGWDFLEGKNKRTGARVIENAELRGLRHLPPRAGLTGVESYA
eukprot:1597502-Prymnesium_polylepis.1